MIPIQSTKIVGIGYNPDTQRLVVQFDMDTFYEYDEVESDTVVRTIFSESTGKVLSQLVEKKPGQQYRRITKEDAYAP